MSAKVFLAICCSFVCSVAVSVRADLPEYCGPQNYAYTPLRKDPRGEFTLKQVHVVIRFVASDVQNNMCYVNFCSSQLLTMFKTNNMRIVNGKSQVRSVWGKFPHIFFMIITIKFCTVVTQFATKIFALTFGSVANALLCHI